MTVLEEAANRIALLDIGKMLNEIYSQKPVQDYIIQLNTGEQLYNQGVASNNKEIGQYAESTKVSKRRKGLISDHITLKDTGDFYNTFQVFIEGDEFELQADPIKGTVNLYQKYGTDIVGLTDQSLNKFINSTLIQQIQTKFLVQIGFL